jgi:phosphoribosylanthranilate isomerase
VTRVKICCIQSVEEAQVAIRCGVSALGLVSAMPSGPGPIAEERIAEITASVRPPIATFLLTCLTDAASIIAQQKRCRASTLQLVDRVAPAVHAELRAALPGVSLVQVVHVSGEASVSEALEAATGVDAVLLDSGNQALPVKQLGGTGKTHDWRLSAQIVKEAPVPVFLAGGLRASNVGEAIRSVSPFGVDVCSGVRTDGHLDEGKLLAFMGAVRETT